MSVVGLAYLPLQTMEQHEMTPEVQQVPKDEESMDGIDFVTLRKEDSKSEEVCSQPSDDLDVGGDASPEVAQEVTARGNDSSSSSNGQSSGAGYNADCSSSDASSNGSSKRKNASSSTCSVKLQDVNVNNLSLSERRSEATNANDMNETDSHLLSRKRSSGKSEIPNESAINADSASVASSCNVSLQLGALDAIIEENLRRKEESSQPWQTLPQWNGVRIAHPGDPRIDLSTVGYLQAPSLPLPLHNDTQGTGLPPPPLPTHDNYLRLMEAVRPFFSSYGAPPVPTPQPPQAADTGEAKGEGSEGTNGGTQSSEGFTAFFTTTENDDSNSDPRSNSDTQQKQNSGPSTEKKPSESHPNKNHDAQAQNQQADKDSDHSDSSSMVVLARVKRKHQKKKQDGGNTSTGSTGSASPTQQQGGNGKSTNNSNENRQQPNSSQTSSSSSSSEANEAPIQMQPGVAEQNVVGGENETARVVSEVNTTSGANTTSGSGSGGNSGTNSGTNSGSGSNPGSSGSGNDDQQGGSGNEQKKSEAVEELKEVDKNASNNTHHAARKSVDNTVAAGQLKSDEPQNDAEEPSREKKLMNKKRKRMDMRREYEEQVKNDMGTDSSSQDEMELRVGNPVTLDTVLSFTKNARVVSQATPPFLIVHANAAFCALTGIDAHTIVGKPTRNILSIPTTKDQFQVAEINNDGSYSGQSSMTNSAAAARRNPSHREAHADPMELTAEDMNIERLVAASGFGRVHLLNLATKPHHMVGRNVTIVRDAIGSPESQRIGEQGSHASSIPSTEGAFHAIPCHVGIAPVVASLNAIDPVLAASMSEQPHAKQRRKHNSQNPHSRRQGSRINCLSHFVLQFKRASAQPKGHHKQQSAESSSSNSVSQEKSGTLEEQPVVEDRAADAPELNDAPDDGTESTDPKEAVSAIG